MERLLARLERRFGRYVPGNLTYYLIGAQVVGLLVGMADPEKQFLLHFEIDLILKGEIWRVLTWLAIPPWVTPGPGATMDMLWALLAFYWTYWIGSTLESEWGAFKFFMFWVLGVVGTILAAAVSGARTDNALFLLTFFLAFATIWPDYQIRLYFLIPIRVKWLAYLDAAYLLQNTLTRDGLDKLIPLVMVANYLLFFHGRLRDNIRGLARQAERAGVRNRTRAERDAVSLPSVRRCAICGVSNEDPEVDIRVCNCEKCGGVMRDLCLPHVRSH